MPLRYSLTAFRAFEAAGRNMSLSKAAAELMVTRPAISKQIRLLESDLGCRLIRRGSGRLQLTPEGKELLTTLSPTFVQMNEAADRIRRSSTGERQLRVLVEADFAASWLADNIGHFLLENTDCTIDLTTERQGNLRLEDSFQFRIFYLDKQLENLSEDRFGKTDLCSWINIPLCAPGYLRDKAGSINEILKSSDLLHDRDRQFWTDWITHAGYDKSLADVGGTVFDSTSLCLSAAVSGAGIAIGDTLTAFRFIREGKLVCPFPFGVTSRSKYILLTDKRSRPSAADALFEAWLKHRTGQFMTDQTALLKTLEIQVSGTP
jgi:DNA-binding transcriptional LysR family regulator